MYEYEETFDVVSRMTLPATAVRLFHLLYRDNLWLLISSESGLMAYNYKGKMGYFLLCFFLKFFFI